MRRPKGSSKISSFFYGFLILALASCLGAFFTVPSRGTLSSPVTFEIGFSPDGESLGVILGAIKRAEESILVAAYSFTSKPVSAALLDAHKRGVSVRVVADDGANSSQYSAVTFLANQGVPVRINGNYSIFHHKFMVLDGRHVETGSFNYSAAAVDRNAENVLLLTNVPEIAGIYAAEWQKLWNESEEVKPRY